MIESHAECVKISSVLGFDLSYKLLRSDTFSIGAQHNRGAVGVICANVMTLVSTHFLKPHPNIGLDVFN
jgi:hypothetical protein